MSTATSSPSPESGEEQPRPDLQVVREPPAESTEDPAELGENTTDVEHQDDDNDGDEPEPLLDSNGEPVIPQAPLDVQIREHVVRYLHGIPAFGQRPASFAEAIEYSQTGDWATSETGAKRALHGMATVLTFIVTWPLVDLLGKARTKPGPFSIALFIVIAASSVLGLVL